MGCIIAQVLLYAPVQIACFKKKKTLSRWSLFSDLVTYVTIFGKTIWLARKSSITYMWKYSHSNMKCILLETKCRISNKFGRRHLHITQRLTKLKRSFFSC